jgi:hypothetical protein
VIKSTALDAKLTRQEEQKIKSSQKIIQYQYWPRIDPDKESNRFWDLRSHRTGTLKRRARSMLLAYAFLRGVPYSKVEPNKKPINGYWEQVQWNDQIVKPLKEWAAEYGGKNFDDEIETWLTL